MALHNPKNISSFKLWIQQIGLWPSQFMVFIAAVLISVPLSICLLSITSVVIQTINANPTDIPWQKLLGDQLALWITPLVEGTQFETSIPLSFQQNWFAIIFLSLAISYGFLNFYSDYLLRHLGEKLAKKLRTDIATKYLSLNYNAANSVDAGLLASIVGEDIRETQQTFTRLISSLIKDGFTSFILLTWLIILDVQLFILFLTVLIPAGIVLRVTGKTLKRLSKQGLQFESELLSGILERMRGWQTIQVHKAIPFEINKFNKINDKIYHVWRRATRAKSLGSPLVEWFGIIAGAFIIIAALRRISNGSLDSNIFISFMLTIALLSDKINRMSSQLNSTRKGTDALHRIRLFLLNNLEERDRYSEINSKEKISKIEFRNLSIGNLGSQCLASNINITLKKGALLAVVGPSGTGKSTFIRTILGVQPPFEGQILINSKVTDEILYQHMAHEICFIPQEPFIFTGTIFENIVYPEKIDNPNEEQIKLALKALQLAQLEKDLSENINGLSGGEKQRLMFSRIFFHKPSFIVIDEGTSALDVGNELKIIENLRSQIAESITIVIAHRPVIKEYATDILDFSKTKSSPLLTIPSDASTKEII
ncbi:ABC transporter transmembrane domain-containing protein [Silvanigrella aquatica]|uniref:ABC transporter ATP-binding protein n=1 Tax=Silvanigrella aquatica TaxID=1915309 RepID=A0A1L4CXZ5_9BACT|nr:ABC transporter ATP-binding protein [Silvanigrella aquatica]APJ02810.1 hypothetical protein AXG55_02265 [Silvanigrella aquatica]